MIGLCAVLLAPLLIVDVPPLLDYPNHLARIFVLASLPHDPVLARFYAAHWSIIPNLALDLAGPPLLHILPVHVVGRLLIAAAILLPGLGTIAYNTALGGRWWSLGVGLVAYNSSLLGGFLNFQIGIGVALLLAAAWLRWREQHPVWAIALATLGAPVLFACHLMGLLFFALLVGGAELFRLYRDPASVLRRGAALLLVFAAPAALYAISPLRQLGGDAEFLPLGAEAAAACHDVRQLQLAARHDDRRGGDRTARDMSAAAMGPSARPRRRYHDAVADRVPRGALCVEGDLRPRYALRHHAGLHGVRRLRPQRAGRRDFAASSPPGWCCCSPPAWRC